MRPTLVAVVLVASLTGGCGLTLAGGAAQTGERAIKPALLVDVSSQAFRDGQGVFGLRLLSTAEHGLRLRSAALHASYDLRLVPGQLVLEPGVELGVGEPLARQFDAPGAFGGGLLQLRWRVAGPNDSEPAYYVYGLHWELVLGLRGGGWMPPERAASHGVAWEWSATAGLRVALVSDLVTAPQGKLADTVSREGKP